MGTVLPARAGTPAVSRSRANGLRVRELICLAASVLSDSGVARDAGRQSSPARGAVSTPRSVSHPVRAYRLTSQEGPRRGEAPSRSSPWPAARPAATSVAGQRLPPPKSVPKTERIADCVLREVEVHLRRGSAPAADARPPGVPPRPRRARRHAARRPGAAPRPRPPARRRAARRPGAAPWPRPPALRSS